MNGCTANVSISTLSCTIAKSKTPGETAALSAFFIRLGDNLTTIAAFNNLNRNENNTQVI